MRLLIQEVKIDEKCLEKCRNKNFLYKINYCKKKTIKQIRYFYINFV